jgi:gamma-glutamyltranspeptidase/glutathione hydrolase
MPFGTPGGDVQCQSMLQTLLNMVVFGMHAQEAVEAPRFATYSFADSFEPHTTYPNRLQIESRIARGTGDALQALGHGVQWWPDWTWTAGAMCVVQADLVRGTVTGAADPRRQAYAAGW